MKKDKSHRILRTVRYVTSLVGVGLLALSLPVSATDLKNGRELYLGHCAGCHGINGVSVAQQTPKLTSFELFSKTDENLFEVVRSGRDKMPPYFGILGDQDIHDVIDYVRTLH
ncbi:MAG: cytochrome c [Nitrosomonadales bacterium]|nr:cytochrome c [Nitrosomonadales bacterium]